jgi:hypothetical protein
MNFAIRHSLFVIFFLSGCAGTAKINLISLNTTAIDPPPTEPWRFDAQQCFWWADETGDFNIAMQSRQGNLFLGKLGDIEIDVSLALDGPPAGSGRDYALRQREGRAVLLSPSGNRRFVVHSGVCDVLTGKDGTYRGSYRLWMTSLSELNVLSFLPARPGPLLCFGSFYAVHDEKRGRAIRELSEKDGWVRPPRKPKSPFSAPTSEPTPPP